MSSATLSQTGSLKTIDTAGQIFGIKGYYCPKAGMPPRAPKYTVPKDKLQNFLEKVKKHSKEVPAPTKYHKTLNWNTANGQFHK